MLSWPSDGPTTRSSTTEIGAASAPARSSSDSSLASLTREPGDLEVIAEHAANGRLIDDFLVLDGALETFSPLTSTVSLAGLDEDHRHRIADMPARDRQHFIAARGIELDRTPPGPSWVVAEVASVSWLPVTMTSRFKSTGGAVLVLMYSFEPSGARPRFAASCALLRMSTRRNSSVATLPNSGVDVRGILHARQLHRDAIAALALHYRLGHAQLVDAIAQHREVLLDRGVLALHDLRRRSATR